MDELQEGVSNLELGKEEEREEEEEREKEEGVGKHEDKGKNRITGVVYDPGMCAHQCEWDHAHPEDPSRITRIWEGLEKDGLVRRSKRVEARIATKGEILTIHTEAHYTAMEGVEEKEKDELWRMRYKYSSIYLNKHTFSSALLAAGCVLEVTERVLRGELTNGIAVVRPPGHHAESHQCMGFCIFNSVAIATKMALDKYNLTRILIVDWDIHHGNATQNQFYEDKRVLYFSLHRYDDGNFYPGKKNANYSFVGGAGAEGLNVNVAWNNRPMGDAEYLSAFHHLLLPIAYEFNPQLVLVSAGFDAAMGDPLGHYRVTPQGYGHMTHQLTGLAGGKVVLALEGGYNLTSNTDSMCACTSVLLGDPLPHITTPMIPNEEAVHSIRLTASAHRPYWRSLSIFSEAQSAQDGACDQSHDQSHDQTRNQSYDRSHDQTRNQSHDQSCDQVVADEVGVAPADSREVQDRAVTQSGMVGEVLFAVSPLSSCEHVSSLSAEPLPPSIASSSCEVCGETKEPWVCLTCQRVFCGRYINRHMLDHHDDTGHPMGLSLADISVWCFPCDSYLDHASLRAVKNAVHVGKFGCEIGGES